MSTIAASATSQSAAEQILRGAGGDQQPVHVPRIPSDHRQHRQLLSGPGLPEAAGSWIGGNQKSCWAISPSQIDRAPSPESGGRYNGRSSATFPLKVRIEYGQPIRSAITVDRICGNA